MFPSTACLIQHKIGARHAWGFDLSAACSAFTYSLTTASQMVATGAHEHALVVGADVMSSIIDYKDRATCVLFGDGAGAVVVSAANGDDGAILDFEHEIDGSGGPALCMPAGGSLRPASHETVDQRLHYVKQDGQTVFKFAVRKTEEIARRLLERNGLTPQDLDLFVSHQANRRIIQSATEKLGLDPEKVIINIERFGNTTAATIPLALNDAVCTRPAEEGRPRAARLGRRRIHGRRRRWLCGWGDLGSSPHRCSGLSRRSVPRSRDAHPVRMGRDHRPRAVGRRRPHGAAGPAPFSSPRIRCGCPASSRCGCC